MLSRFHDDDERSSLLGVVLLMSAVYCTTGVGAKFGDSVCGAFVEQKRKLVIERAGVLVVAVAYVVQQDPNYFWARVKKVKIVGVRCRL